MSVNKVILEKWYLEDKKSTTDIARLCGLAPSTVRLRLIEYNIPLRSRADGIRHSRHKLGPNKGKTRVSTNEWKDNISKGRLRWSQKHAKGARINTNGYYEYTKGEYTKKTIHVVMMEKLIGRSLRKDEVVHHRNEIKTDNRIENLVLMTRSEHSRLHAVGRASNRNKEGRFTCQ